MRAIAIGLLLVMVGICAGCANHDNHDNGGHRQAEGHQDVEYGKAELVKLWQEGHSGAEILKKARRDDVVVKLSDDDVIDLVSAGIDQKTINALLELAKKGHAHEGGDGH